MFLIVLFFAKLVQSMAITISKSYVCKNGVWEEQFIPDLDTRYPFFDFIPLNDLPDETVKVIGRGQ
jgi:hypothetical protein